MNDLIDLISKSPSWLIIIVVIGFVVEPLIKLLKRRKAKQEIKNDSAMIFSGKTYSAGFGRANANPMFPASNTLRPLDPASLYRGSAPSSRLDAYDDYDEFEDNEDDYDEYNRRKI